MPTARPTPLPANPLLSVVMPVYNERTTVEEIIRRVLAVPLRIELIVVDDGSKDGSGEILDRLAQELGFKLLRQANAQRILSGHRGSRRHSGRRPRILARGIS
jgi:cellulose synthase/poly-beta-1,6-N-acetylglucosamine synthase-like glycosyltransferase